MLRVHFLLRILNPLGAICAKAEGVGMLLPGFRLCFSTVGCAGPLCWL